ncbi:cytochrome b/b6 domain-containing protein [Denitromonas halophila]|uniref:Cytochrome B n=1 Tax=Denitromonas halophila TaxID=1629404 RepID=A0A557QG51_9RHOO|nr:cytochrome b/b6 domain-containing protein [Denitromonas halophila]TVO51869.1 cytochrome B [Denitromonas halophila]
MSKHTVLIWDLPTRLFHWLLVGCLSGAVISVKIGGNAMIWHGRFGLAIVGLLGFRLAWGFVGSHTARFTQFVRGPATIAAYLRGQWQGIGHNPLGALSVLAMLLVLFAQALTGLVANDDIAFTGPLYAAVSKDLSDALTGWHRRGEWAIFALIALHLAALLYYRLIKKEPLIRPMITGRKPVTQPAPPTPRHAGPLAFIVSLSIGASAVWIASGALLPPPPPPPPTAVNTPAW